MDLNGNVIVDNRLESPDIEQNGTENIKEMLEGLRSDLDAMKKSNILFS